MGCIPYEPTGSLPILCERRVSQVLQLRRTARFIRCDAHCLWCQLETTRAEPAPLLHRVDGLAVPPLVWTLT